ncbi:UNKNOWN [Stylonychia lemnae]|uniref:Uncharacterized protein n=1 Tax=Stylonychia lemnae TaxID=5949 RepID=A0A077ZPN9_STYLE|nr:UNKNOWN [Stylonychia lemnae]|eukprot:CDW71429.1 UNKNOWN [Stylonychia lemnae]
MQQPSGNLNEKKHKSKKESVIMKDKIAHDQACKKQMRNRFKSIDYFGQSVTFTYNGEDQFKTLFGAAISLVLMIVLLAFGIYKFVYLVNRWNPNVIKTSFLRDLKEEPAFRPQDLGFDFAFGIGEDIPANIGGFTVRQIEFQFEKYSNGTQKRVKKPSRDLNITKCGSDLFRYDDKQELVDLEIDQMNCLKETEYELKGNFYAQEYKYLELKLWKCGSRFKSSANCANETAMQQYFSDKTFSFAFINTQFVLDSYDPQQRLQYFIDDSLLFELESQRIKKTNFYVQKSEGELEDSLLQLGQSEMIEFHQATNFKTYDDEYTNDDGYIVAIYIRFDRTYDNYERKVYGFLEFLGDLGGLQGSLISIGMFFVGFVAQRLFFSKIIKKIYQVRKYDNFDSNNQTNHTNYNTQHNAIYPSTSIQNVNGDQTVRSSYEADQQQFPQYEIPGQYELIQTGRINDEFKAVQNIKEKEHSLQREYKFKNQIQENDIGNILFAFLNRERFSYAVKDIIHYILKCMCFRNIEENRKRKIYKKHFLFEKAEEKFMQELDAIRIVKTLRKFKMLAQALLSQKQRLVLRFQRQNLIETSSSSSDSDNNNYDTVRLMENPNPLIRLVIFGKLKKMIQGFTGKKLDPLERNMMRGMFIRKLKDFAEDSKDLAENQTLLQRLKGEMGLPNTSIQDIDKIQTKPGDQTFNKLATKDPELDYFEAILQEQIGKANNIDDVNTHTKSTPGGKLTKNKKRQADQQW